MTKVNASLAGNPLRTRADAQQLVRDLFASLVPQFSSGRARVRFDTKAASYDIVGGELEGFSRPLWGIAPLVAGGGPFEHAAFYIDGLTNGTDPEHEEYWGPVGDYDQRAVEMAAIGYALSIAPETFWEPLSRGAKANLATWLKGIETVIVHDDNWHFFVVMVQEGLRRVGVAIDETVREFHLQQIDDYYLGDGWYGDGPQGYVDHYNGYAIHTYSMLFVSLTAGRGDRRVEPYLDRVRQFAPAYRSWFGGDGPAIPFGRSMTYRFAMASIWGALAVANVEVLPWAEIRGLWARNIRYWLGKPIADDAGRLTLGFGNANPLIIEEYSSPNSPYWAMKALLPLSLPPEHPFWQAEEGAVAALPATITVPAASFVAHRRGHNAILWPGAPQVDSLRNAPDKYGKFAYSSTFGFAVESDRWLHLGYAGDNALALSPDGRHWRVREEVTHRELESGRLRTHWSPWAECTVETVQAYLGPWEIRAHKIVSSRVFESLESGFAVAAFRSLNGPALVVGGRAIVRTKDAVTALIDLTGGRLAGALPVMPNTHLLFPYATVPVLKTRFEAGVTVLAALVYAQPGEDEAPAMPSEGDIAAFLGSSFG